MDKKIMLLKPGNKNMFFPYIENVFEYYKHKNFLFRILNKMNSYYISLFYGVWKEKLNSYDVVILFDTGFNYNIPKYIKRKNPNIKVIFWYWNSIDEYLNRKMNYMVDKVINNKYIDEIWTYNRYDAKKYELKYNTQFYKKTVELENKEIVNDVLYLGRDKGREQEINNVIELLKNKNLKADVHIVKSSKDILSYDSYLQLLSQSKCILDMSYIVPCGLSLRPLESIFYEKKLITNNTDIKNYDFYKPNNIFVLGEDNIDNLNDFINTSYEKVDSNIVDYYNYESWLNRFVEE